MSFLLAAQLGPASAQSVFPNGSFEAGEPPIGWHARSGGTVTTAEPHRGERGVAGATRSSNVVWESDSVAFNPQTDYRLEGWVRCPTGEGCLEVELADAAGNILRRVAAPTIRRTADWRYTAAEWNAGPATSRRVAFRVKGKADLDDVSLSPIAASFIGNKSVDGDERGRIYLWGEEPNHGLRPGRRAGKLALDAEVKRTGKTSVRLATDGDWFVLASVNHPVGLCMFEGKGTLNPPRYHHRYNSIPGRERGAVPGTIPNGFVREMDLADRPGFNLSRTGGRSPSFRTSEPWLVHNIWYLLATSAWEQATKETDTGAE